MGEGDVEWKKPKRRRGTGDNMKEEVYIIQGLTRMSLRFRQAPTQMKLAQK